MLERAGLVGRCHRAQYHPCSLEAAPLEDLSTWAEQNRSVLKARLNRMDDYIGRMGVGGSAAQPFMGGVGVVLGS